VLDNADEPSSLAASLSMVVELLEGRVDTVATNGIRWGTWPALVVTLLHFPKIELELELLRFEHNTDLKKDLADALEAWCVRPQTRWLRTFLLRLLTALLMAQGSSSGGSLRH
jgi:hypothetical protein